MWWCSPALGHANGSNSPLSRADRKHGLSTEQFPVPAFVESSKNLQGLKGLVEVGARRGVGFVVVLTRLASGQYNGSNSRLVEVGARRRVGLVVGEAEHPRLFFE